MLGEVRKTGTAVKKKKKAGASRAAPTNAVLIDSGEES